MDLGLRDRVALVTGASKGIGRGDRRGAGRGGRAGRDLVAVEERIQAAAAEIGARGYAFDAGDLDAVAGAARRVQADLGPIDIYIANTGGPPPGDDPLAFTREQWEAAHRTLVLSPMAFLERLLPGMRERGFGRVVAIGSIGRARADRRPAALQLPPPRPGGGVQGARAPGRARRRHAQPRPPWPDRHRAHLRQGTREEAEAQARETVPAGRLGTVEELAAAAVFLCSVPAGYITGTSLLVDGGLSRSVS